MKTIVTTVLFALLALAPHSPAAETQNGLQISVAPKTISRNDARYSIYFANSAINRMMALQIIAKNVSTRGMPEGSIVWQILVIGASGGSTLYSGKENLPALKTAASKELLVGSAQITGWRDGTYQRKDKLEYKVLVNHGGAITATVVSTPAFEALATHANRVQPPGE
jgi:hypothetical protein